MAKLSSDELLDAFKEMTLIELSEFVKLFEDTFGKGAPAPSAVGAAPASAGGGTPDDPQLSQDEFDVVLEIAGDKKINVIKEVRALTSLGLKEAKELVESAPKAVYERVDKAAALKARDMLVSAGATVTLRGFPASSGEAGIGMSGGEFFLRTVREEIFRSLTSAEVDRALDADETDLREWLSHPEVSDGSIGARLVGLLETAAAFVAIWDWELFPAWLFDPSPYLDGGTPADLIVMGRKSDVLASIADSAYGVYA